MWGQGKTVWQAAIDAHGELCDFWRFNCKFAEGEHDDMEALLGAKHTHIIFGI